MFHIMNVTRSILVPLLDSNLTRTSRRDDGF